MGSSTTPYLNRGSSTTLVHVTQLNFGPKIGYNGLNDGNAPL